MSLQYQHPCLQWEPHKQILLQFNHRTTFLVICEITCFSGNVDKIDITGDRVDEVKIKLCEASSMAGYLRLNLAGL